MGKKGAEYIEHNDIKIPTITLKKDRNFKHFLMSIFSFLAIFLIIFSISTPVNIAFADEEDEEDTSVLDDALSNFFDGKTDSDGFMDAADKAEKDWDKNKDRSSFSYLFYRLLAINYLNETPDASSGDGGKNLDRICETNNSLLGTPLYHNCDIPNFTTEFFQDVISLIDDDGVAEKGAKRHSAKVFLPQIGLPSSIIKNGVPIEAKQRNKKYTGLELYGYNLQFSSYNGEWDHIKVMTSARAMSNFGLMDKLKLGGSSIVNGITSGFTHGVENFGESFKKGDIIGMLTAPFSGATAGAADSVNTVLDSSDLNVHNSYGWYRVNYPNTLYNARQLTQAELATVANQASIDYLASQFPETAKIPEDLEKVSSAPGKLKEGTAGCKITITDGDSKTTKEVESSSQSNCNNLAVKEATGSKTATGVWSKDLLGKEETISEWKKRYSDYFDMVDKYNIDIALKDSGSASEKVNAFISAWPAAHKEASKNYLDGKQDDLFKDWKGSMLKRSNIANWLTKENPERNFNAPYMRFICTNKNGNDLKKDGKFVWLYDENGKINSDCSPVRPPIQGAMFGDGYTSDQASSVSEDTRRSQYSFGIMEILRKNPIFLGDISIMESLANFNLKISSFITRISNTFLNLSMSPNLDFFGINKLIISLIKSFKDSVFMSLALLVIGVSALMVLVSTMKTGNYKQGFINIGTILLTFIVGLLLLQFPKEIVNAMDKAPSYIQSVIMATVFNAGKSSEDILCEASNKRGNSVKGFDGKSVGYEPTEASRTLMCENWRIFTLTPWVHGQWGTSLNNLFNSKMTNTNEDIVGTGYVNMGNGQSMNNWAIYQLDVSSSGTSTTENTKEPTGELDTNFYRLVDLQFGPDNAAASDTRYASAWAGGNLYRTGTTLLGIVMSIAGAAVIILYSVNLIQVSIVSSLMLIALPFVILIGLNPTFGKGKMFKFLETLLSLLIQRVVLVTLLAIMFTLLISTANSTNNFVMLTLITVFLSIAFIFFRKDIMGMLNFGLSNMANRFTDDPKNAVVRAMPKSIQNRVNFATSKVKGYAGGYIAGMANAKSIKPSDLKQAHTSAKEAGKQASGASYQKAFNRERRMYGFGSLTMAKETADKVADETRQSIKNDIVKKGLFDELDKEFEIKDASAALDFDRLTPSQLRRISKINEHLDNKDTYKENSYVNGRKGTRRGDHKKKKSEKKEYKFNRRAQEKINEHYEKFANENMKEAKKRDKKINRRHMLNPLEQSGREVSQKYTLKDQINQIDLAKQAQTENSQPQDIPLPNFEEEYDNIPDDYQDYQDDDYYYYSDQNKPIPETIDDKYENDIDNEEHTDEGEDK